VVVLDQIGDLQVLVIDHIMLAHQCDRCLVVEVSSLATHRQMRLRQYGHGLSPALAPLFCLATRRWHLAR
jgi:hypothetical protein